MDRAYSDDLENREQVGKLLNDLWAEWRSIPPQLEQMNASVATLPPRARDRDARTVDGNTGAQASPGRVALDAADFAPAVARPVRRRS